MDKELFDKLLLDHGYKETCTVLAFSNLYNMHMISVDESWDWDDLAAKQIRAMGYEVSGDTVILTKEHEGLDKGLIKSVIFVIAILLLVQGIVLILRFLGIVDWSFFVLGIPFWACGLIALATLLTAFISEMYDAVFNEY